MKIQIIKSPKNINAIGGILQSHGSDWGTGLVTIGAGGDHESNPYDGVQVGVDSNNIPNLVEENETIFNDYVFSKRIELDDQAKERFHVSKKRDITYAEMSKKLEKESSERPNDPISQAALKMQMEDLQEEQERQKAEMQAEEAREAFENMSPEEQVAVMQQIEAQDQQTAEEEAAMQEQAMAEQQMSPEEAAMAEQQMAMQQQGMPPEGMMQGMPQGIPMEAQMSAYGGPLNEFALGGNLFELGGVKDIEAWLAKTYPNFKGRNRKNLAEVMFKRLNRSKSKYTYTRPLDPTKTLRIDFEKLYADTSPMTGYYFNTGLAGDVYLREGTRNEKYFRELVADGMDKDLAFEFAFPKNLSTTKYSNYKAYKEQRERTYNILVKGMKKPSPTEVGGTDKAPIVYGNASRAKLKSTSQASSSTTQSSTAQAAKPAAQSTRQTTTGTAQGSSNHKVTRAANGKWYSPSTGRYYVNRSLALTAERQAAKRGQSAPLATPTAGGDTLIANAPSGGGYSADYSGYGYTGGGGGGYSAPVSTGGTTVAAPTAGVSYVPLYNQDGSLKGYTVVPQQSAQAAAQTTAAPATPTIAPYSVDSLRSQILGALGVSTASELQDWASKNNVTGFDNYDAIDWENLTSNQSFMDALNKGNSALAHAIANKYDFGKYRPVGNKGEIQSVNAGNWDTSGSGNDLDKFWKGWESSEDDMWKEAIEKGYIKKGMSLEDIQKGLMKTQAWNDTTNWLKDSPDNMLAYLQAIEDSDAPDKAKKHYMVDANGKDRGWVVKGEDGKLRWKEGYTPNYDEIFGTVRHTYPGSYWHTYTGARRNPTTVNFVQKEDGTWDRVIGDVGSDWKKVNTYSWYGQGDDNNNYTYNYYTNPALAKAAAQKKADEAAAKEYEPVLKPEWPRYAGLFGPAVGLGMMAAGIGRPDTKQLDAVLDAYNRKGARFADYKPIGNYLAYKPMDIWANQNRMNANARATDRAIANNAGPLGTRNAGLIANSYASQLGTGQLHRDALAYNDQLEQQVAGFNRGTDQFNAESYNRAALQNAQIANHDRGLTAQLGMQAAQQKMAADAGWYGSMYGNINNLFKGISDLGTENARHNMIARMAADNLFGTITDYQNIGQGYVRERAAEGGNLNRKKNKRRKGGLTI